ncbi:MAG: hypothetical protein IKN77_12285 [Paludibacteraceae bacterium]|nr:hypothetical protein [Paludibacteraceae bacterium]
MAREGMKKRVRRERNVLRLKLSNDKKVYFSQKENVDKKYIPIFVKERGR